MRRGDILKPCPFCAGEAGAATGPDGELLRTAEGLALVSCESCGVDMYNADAVERWNRRARKREVNMLYFIVGCLIIGLFISFSIGWWCGERHARRNTMVGIPSTSINKQSTQSSQLQWLPVGSGFDPNINHPDIGYYVKR